MGDTSIEWTEKTWNPIRGCSRVSTGCENCYAEQVAKRFAGPGLPYEGLVRIGKDGKPRAQWNGTIKLVPEHLGDPLRWTKPRLVFVNSMSDLFHPGVPFEYIAAVFGVMAAARQHTFQVLTKRPERARAFFTFLHAGQSEHAPPIPEVCGIHAANYGADVDYPGLFSPWPLPNVWLGVSVEDQASADARIPVLLTLPAAVRWVSYEPALGPVDFCHLQPPDPPVEIDALHGTHGVLRPHGGTNDRLDWIVIGGESGPGARPFDPAWARNTIAACRDAGVACFVKQCGARPILRDRYDVSEARFAHLDAAGWTEHDGPPTLRDRKGGDWSEWPADLRVREWPEVRS